MLDELSVGDLSRLARVLPGWHMRLAELAVPL